METKTYTLTEEEYDLIMSALENEKDIHQDRTSEPGDEEDQEASLLARLENELLWQHAYEKRRPVQY